MMKRHWKLGLAMAPVSALFALASHAAPLAGSARVGFVPPSIFELRDTFSRATASGPMDPALVSFLASHIAPIASPSQSPGGGRDIDEDPLATPGGTRPPAVRILPIASLEPAAERDLHFRTALHERLLKGLRDYRESKADADRADEVERLGQTAHLELFVGYALFYLEGESREQKCLAHERAVEHARQLGWEGTALPMTPKVREGWGPLADAAKSLHDGPFATQIPAHLCDARSVVRKTEVESQARAAVDARIGSRVETEIDATTRTLAGKQAQYASALNASVVAVPTREIFALKRAVEDSATLYEMVRSDALMLERAPQTTPPQAPLLERLRTKRAQLDELRTKAGGGELDAVVSDANKNLAANAAIVKDLRDVLKQIAETPGLNPATATKLAVCTDIPEQITPEGLVAMAATLDACLVEVGTVYGDLKKQATTDPDATLFAQKSSGLSKAYINYVNSLRRQ
jgi:hypothetical protein